MPNNRRRYYPGEYDRADLPSLAPLQLEMLSLCEWQEDGCSGVHPKSKPLGVAYPIEQWEWLVEINLLRRYPSGYLRLTPRGDLVLAAGLTSLQEWWDSIMVEQICPECDLPVCEDCGECEECDYTAPHDANDCDLCRAGTAGH